MTPIDQLARSLVPEPQAQRAETRPQCHRCNRREHRARRMAALEVVVRNPGTQVVDMVKPDIAREPLQDLWQAQERAALERGDGVVPVLGALPVGVLILVLHIKQPYAASAGAEHDRALQDEVGHEPENGAHHADHRKKRDVGVAHRSSFAVGSVLAGESLQAEEEHERRHNKQHKRNYPYNNTINIKSNHSRRRKE